MRVIVPVWEGRVSPVLDVAENLLLVDVENGQQSGRSLEKLGNVTLPQRAHRISELGAEVVICGAISRPLADMLHAAGVTIIPCIMGEIEDVLSSYLDDGVADSKFFMPGYSGPGGHRRRHGRYGRFDR